MKGWRGGQRRGAGEPGLLGWGGEGRMGGENEGPAPEGSQDWGSREPVRGRVGGGRMEGGWSVVMATGSPVALAARREGRRRDRQGPADPCGGVHRAHSAWPRHYCDTPPARTRVLHAKMQMSGTRSPHMPDTRRRDPHRQAHHIQRWTAISRRGHVHVTHKDAGTTAALGTYRQAGPRHRCTLSHRNSKASQRPTPATK